MGFSQDFVGFLQAIAVGSLAVFILFFIIGLNMPRRSPALANRRIPR